ncbi:C-5 cytosine-specific DNA methylase family protein [Helicobacter pylori SouthAfrica20]|uniref:C-5 cytosine-specific DNA methylase family protein n=1 Tax=Helicobacter pylori SouthAfrica20 TaxID=1352356 RepID=T1U927_HELPX|nr:C-5 cytosine-specific DNA methylase family protein [Helicobacter pylori SouthAfrica20]
MALLYSACHNALDYGVPQMRERVILVGVLKSFKQKFYFPKPTKMHFLISLYLSLFIAFY